jgi:hypothetical protein
MPVDLQGRGQYLELALFSQNVVSALLEFVDKDREDRLEPSLNEALTSLNAVTSDDLNRLVGERVAAFSSYEQLKTLNEVWSKDDIKEAAEVISRLLRAPKPSKKKADAERLVDLFSKLQKQALRRHFQQPLDAAIAW